MQVNQSEMVTVPLTLVYILCTCVTGSMAAQQIEGGKYRNTIKYVVTSQCKSAFRLFPSLHWRVAPSEVSSGGPTCALKTDEQCTVMCSHNKQHSADTQTFVCSKNNKHAKLSNYLQLQY